MSGNSGILLYLLHVLKPSMHECRMLMQIFCENLNEELYKKNPPAETVSQIVPINSHFPARISKINIEDSRE